MAERAFVVRGRRIKNTVSFATVAFALNCCVSAGDAAKPREFVSSEDGRWWARPGGAAFLPDADSEHVAGTCDVEAVQDANIRQLHPILYDLVNTTFFRLFRVKLKHPKCPFWKKAGATEEESHSAAGSCTGSLPGFGASPFGIGLPLTSSLAAGPAVAEPACGIEGEQGEKKSRLDDTTGAEHENIDMSMTRAERKASDKASEVRKLEGSDSCEEDLPGYFADICSSDSSESESEDVNLMKNPERNTGYNGSHIWEAMYNENCFEVGRSLPRGRFGEDSSMCYEEKVLYRLLSAWHASTTISISRYFYPPSAKSNHTWAPNPERFMRSFGKHPERLKNLHFSFVVLLRAIKKAGPYFRQYTYTTGDEPQLVLTKNLIDRFLDSQVLSLCSPLFDAFDENRLFQEGTAERRSILKRQFKSVFRNITVLTDCVQCQRCRVHAKLFSLGLGSALKILLTPPELIAQSLARDEVVALWNVLWKLSDAMEDARIMTDLYWRKTGATTKTATDEAAAYSAAEPPPSPRVSTADAAPPAERLRGALQHDEWQTVRQTYVAPSPSALPALERLGWLDAAFSAVKSSADQGKVDRIVEESALRSLVVRPASDDLLLFAKHYARDRPALFATLASEAAVAWSGSEALRESSASTRAAILGSSDAPADVVVIGGGLAGMVATIIMLDRGGSVVMVEKQPYLGGNSGKASSGINAALETSVDSLIKDTTKSAGALARPDLIATLANDSAPAVDWLRNRFSVDLSMRSQLGGHTEKRTLRPANAFVGAEITFAAGQLLKQMAAEKPHQFRILTNAKMTDLRARGSTWQVIATVNESDLVVEARAAVVASGGFGHDAKEVESYMLKHRPDLENFPTTLGSQTTGDGLKIAQRLGAALIDMDRVQLHPTGFVDSKKPEEVTKTLAAELLRGVGGLLLDRHGARFTDELGTRQAVVNEELQATKAGRNFPRPLPVRSFALVLNAKAAAAADRHVTLYSKKGLLSKVEGYAGLAAYLNVSSVALRKTFDEYNVAAISGKDSFNRTIFPPHTPIVEDEDFFVGFVVPVIHYTMGGIAIDTDARVLSASKLEPIPGLYAIGEASGGVHGDNRLAGNSLLECTVFGRRVGLGLPIFSGRGLAQSGGAQAVPAAAATKAAPAAPAAPTLRAIQADELAQHKSRTSSWVSLYGKVYDLTSYIEEHPGGAEAILDVAGVDGTEHYAAVHTPEMLETMGFEPLATFSG